jgi:hypothetical protein
MGSHIKSMCKVDRKLIDKYPEEFFTAVNKPKYVCKKCLRAASDKAFLCSPKSLGKKKKKK